MDLIVYHSGCPDGWCAAYIAKKRFPEAALFPATHGGELPDVKDKDVLVVDFSWKRHVTLQLAAESKSMIILDHHKTAEAELAGLGEQLPTKLDVVFDMNRSGAGLAWDCIFGSRPASVELWAAGNGPLGLSRPWYVDYVEDRDLWRWKLWKSKEVSAYIMSVPQDFATWDAMAKMAPEAAITEGAAILRHIDQYMGKVAAEAQYGVLKTRLDPTLPPSMYAVAIVNAAYPNISEVCHLLCERGAGIGMGWFQRRDGLVQFSLRSIGDVDVSQLAKQFGGGGHKNAAGFQLPRAEAFRLIDSILEQANPA